MKPKQCLVAAGAVLLLAGCLEVEQHPDWRKGAYDGKPDDLAHQRNFHGDRLAWMARIIDRNWLQDEYRRTHHQGAPRG
jgi:hypothetical protein